MEIEFSTNEEYLNLKDNHPTPIKLNMPDWFKKLKHGDKHIEQVFEKTVKGCVPFLETLTNGYLLKMPVDYHIRFGNEKNEKGEPVVKITTSLDFTGEFYNQKGLNINAPGVHNIDQLKGAPEVKKNGWLPFPKIANPWYIKTPPGYSCLFLNPLNNQQQDFFSIIPGIVHTDKYTDQEINFPIVINYEKYGHMELNIPRGTPYVQIIPFKRDNWKMKITPRKKKRIIWNISFLHNYKNRIFNKDKTSWT